MLFSHKLKYLLAAVFTIFFVASNAQSILPPALSWNGKSTSLIVGSSNPWITPAEQSNFTTTPSYTQTMEWLTKLANASPELYMVSIGKSVEGRSINMMIASTEKNVTVASLKKSSKPLILIQAGIHAGEIDGKDAGLMLLRDIAFSKKQLLNKVNILFIPILNVDGHERSSAYNRPNQRGPENMGWRTNAQNYNLNRDYTKLDTKEIQSVIKVMNEYDPVLYMDLHVTDGVDYQYDITYGSFGKEGYSPAISEWLDTKFTPATNKELHAMGHIPGPFLNARNYRDFSEGNINWNGSPRFSNCYGDLRHLAAILVENHSLKPYKQRVLGTYVLLESTIKLLASEGQSLKEGIQKDKSRRETKIPIAWKVPLYNDNINKSSPDSMDLLGIQSRLIKSTITNADYVEWLGIPTTMRIADYKTSEPVEWLMRPRGYWVPAYCDEVIKRLQLHGIKMEISSQPKEVNVEMYRIKDTKFENEEHTPQPFEGHIQVSGIPVAENHTQIFPSGSAYISTDQPLGDLAIILLEPASPDSYFHWGFFMQIFQRTEYVEAYVMEPMMKKMLDNSPELKLEFEQKKQADKSFANSPEAIMNWFYSKTKYYDDRYLLYPVGRVL